MRVQALMPFTYNMIERNTGDQFDISSDHEFVLTVSGRIKKVEAEEKPKQVLEQRDLKADDNSDEAHERRRKRKYMRRDMRPEE